MNTSRIGAEYERAYKQYLERKGLHVERSAASHGIFDLTAHDGQFCWHVQLKSRETNCRAMSVLAGDIKVCVPEHCRTVVVHGGPIEALLDETGYRFCEHVG